MDDGLKQRLIGAVVLIALAVIFLPVLFERENLTVVDQTTQIPSQPEITKVVIPETIVPVIEDPAPEPGKMFIPDESEPATLEPESVGLKPDGIPKSWVLQVASFKDKTRADKLRDELIKKKHNAYVREISKDNQTMTRVYVGPKLDKNTLLQLKKELDKTYKVNSVILNFNPK